MIKILTGLTILILLVPSVSFAAIAFDTNSAGSPAAAASVTWSHTNTGDNRYLLVAVVGAEDVGSDYITGVTYNGVSMTLVFSKKASSGTNRWRSFWYLSNPASGANDVVVSSSPSDYIEPYAVSYTGVEDAAPEASAFIIGENVTDLTLPITTIADNSWVIAYVHADIAPANVSAGTDTFERVATKIFERSDNPITPAGSAPIDINISSQRDTTIIGVSLAPFVVPPPVSITKMQAIWW